MRKRVYEITAVSVLHEVRSLIMAFSKNQAAFIFKRDKLSKFDTDSLRLNNYVIRVKQLDQGDF